MNRQNTSGKLKTVVVFMRISENSFEFILNDYFVVIDTFRVIFLSHHQST